MSWSHETAVRAIAEVALGRQRSPKHDDGPHMVKYLRAANVKNGALDLSDVKMMNFTPDEQSIFSLRPGDVLVTEGSGSLSSVGASAVWRGEIDGTVCFQNTLLRLRPRSGVASGDFLGWWARSAHGSGLFASLSSGANIYHLSAERVRSLRVSIPSLEEQQRIVDLLDAEVGRVESLVSARRSQMQVLEERESSLISERFIPGSVGRASGEFPWPWLPRTSECPSLVRLGYLCHVQGGVTVDASRETSETDVTRPYLRVANVKADRLELDSVTEITVPKAVADRSTLQPGDVLMTEGGDIDKLGRGTVWSGELPGALHQNHVFALRPDSERLDAEYLALLTRSLHGRCYFEATGVKSTNLASTSSSKVKSFPVPLISLEEQRKAVAEVKDSLAEVGRLRTALIRQIDLLEERKRALITAAVTGQIDVTTARGADLS